MRSDQVRGMTVTTLGVLIISPDALIVRLVEADLSTLLFWRGLLTGAAIFAFHALRHGRGALAHYRAIGGPGLLAGAILGVGTVLFVASIRHTSVANTLVIVTAEPLFAAVFSFVFLRERIARRTWMAVLCAVGGMTVILWGSLGGGTLLGDLCAVGAACCLAGNLTVVRYARSVDMVPSVALSGLVAALLVTPFAAPLSPGPMDAALLAILGMVVLPLSLALITLGPRYLPAPEVGLLLLLETLLGPFWVWLGIGEVPPATTFLGGAVVIATVATHALVSLHLARVRSRQWTRMPAVQRPRAEPASRPNRDRDRPQMNTDEDR